MQGESVAQPGTLPLTIIFYYNVYLCPYACLSLQMMYVNVERMYMIYE